jgi:phosphate/phosphite/phosphonate ABC transporter binding protein
VPLAALALSLGAGQKEAAADIPAAKQRVLRVGAVAYSPDSVTIWRGIRYYFKKNGMPLEYVLYATYDDLVQALHTGQVDVAWNSPLAHAKYHLLAGGQSQALVMRDVDCGFRVHLVVRKDAGIASPADLAGKTMIFGSCDSAEATVLPRYFLKKAGVALDKIKVLSLHDEVDDTGCPCHSEHHVLKALQESRGSAGILSVELWKDLQAKQPQEAAKLKVIWTSPPFSHCVFTARKDFDKDVAARFTKLMLAMDASQPLTAQILRLENASRWVAGSQEGYADLLAALRMEQAAAQAK